MSAPTLKPCPFCGKTEDLAITEGTTFRWMRVVCGCGVDGPEARVQTLGNGTREQWEAQGRIDAAEEWNRRA